MLLSLASLTGPLVNFATHLIGSLGLAGVTLLTLMTGVVGFPGTEPTMLFAGFDVFQGNLSLPGIIVAGVVGDVAGASIAYGIGYYGRRELEEHSSSRLHVSAGGLDRAHRWFDRWGDGAILVSRVLPFVRSAFPYAAGVVKMPLRRFLPLATVGSLIWISALGVLGREVGSQWQSWRHHLEYVDYVGALVVIATVVVIVVRWVRANRERQAQPAGAERRGDPADRPRAAEAPADVVRD